MARIAPPPRRRTAVWTARAALSLGAALAVMAFAELGLRAAGAVMRRIETRPSGAFGDGKIRVLCLGESTTVRHFPFDYSWPGQLQERLDAAAAGKFTVINRARTAIDTDVIADRLPLLLDAERPDIVVTMMGVNDRQRESLRLEAPKPDALVLLRIWRWARREIGRREWLARRERRAASQRPEDAARRSQACWEILGRGIDVGDLDVCAAEAETPSSGWKSLVASGGALFVEGRRSEAERRFDAALRAAPDEQADVHAAIAGRLLQWGEFDGFERHWKAAWAARPWNEGLVSMRFDEFLGQGRDAAAVRFAREAAARDPRKDFSAGLLLEATQIRDQDPPPVPSDTLRAGAAAHLRSPDDVGIAFNLARAYAEAGRNADADPLMKELIRLRGLSPQVYIEAAWYFFRRGRMTEAASAYLHVNDEEDDDREAVEKFAEKLLAAGRRDEAARLYEYIDEAARTTGVAVDARSPLERTRANYERVGRALRARGIVWVAMQYPLRPIETLRALTVGFPEVVLVENRGNFLDVERRAPSLALFSDRFAGDFGHGTGAGNSLLAESAARAVLAAAR